MENDVFSAIKAAEQLLLDSLDMDVGLVMKLKELAREIFCEEEPVPRPERSLNMWPHQIPRRRPVPVARRCCSPYQS